MTLINSRKTEYCSYFANYVFRETDIVFKLLFDESMNWNVENIRNNIFPRKFVLTTKKIITS